MPSPLNKFDYAINQIKKLSQNKRYTGAFIFGSYARGDHGVDSDLDVIVLVDADNPCNEVNHTLINGVKLDITFRSLRQVEVMSRETAMKGERAPMLSESLIVFDKSGEILRLKNEYANVSPKKVSLSEYQNIQFLIFHADNKAKINLAKDPYTSLLVMSISLNDILKFHYSINGKWWLSDKRLLSDLRVWDIRLATLIEKFVSESRAMNKYEIWTRIINHVARAFGGRKRISELNCTCDTCAADLRALRF